MRKLIVICLTVIVCLYIYESFQYEIEHQRLLTQIMIAQEQLRQL